jgi:uncharacterized protein YndB with AHSA1/START domain
MTSTTQRRDEPESTRTAVVTRVMELPARLLFEAYTKPEHVKRWFGPPGYPLTLCEMDFRPGGKFRFAMTGPEGVQHTPFGGTYLEIVKNERIAYDNAFETLMPGMPEALLGRMVVTVTFDALEANKTRLTVSTLFDTKAMHDAHVGMGYEQGVGASIPQLEAVARSLAKEAQ